MSNLGPLPTDFLSSSHCERALDDLYFVDDSYLVQGNINQVTCYPNGYAGKTEQYYSPAHCPSGFTRACSSTNRIDTLEETIYVCCPTNRVFTCQSTSSLTWESTLGCVSEHSRQQSLNVIIASDSSTSLYTLAIGAIGAYSVQVRYQSTDFASSTSFSAKAITPTSTSTGATSTNTNTAGMNNGVNNNNQSMGVSAGVIAGIAIGAFAGGLIATVGIWYLIKQKRWQRRRQRGKIPASEPSNIMTQQQLYATKSSATTNSPQELRGNQIHELPNDYRP
ncbi:hypothetical protein F5Y14DRAFT_410252 [Nemania sp. NC0429]|nr:hypothetical protein F5Y14DRAFT_410252 [Nemania sp. NC0429]